MIDNKKKIKHKTLPGKPNGFFYFLGSIFIPLYMRLKHGMKVTWKTDKPDKEPFVVLANHCSNIDFLAVFTAFGRIRINFMVAHYFFLKKSVAPLLHLVGCIEKKQFATDLKSVKQCINVIRRGGAVCLFPSGQVSPDGAVHYIPSGIEKLLKKLDVDVYFATVYGGTISRPKWGVLRRHGAYEVVVEKLCSREALRSIEDSALYGMVFDKLQVNDPEWATRNGRTVKTPVPLRGITSVLYLCPSCGKIYSLRESDTEVRCTSCGYTAHMTDAGWLTGSVSTVREWMDLQREQLHNEISADPENYSLSLHGKLSVCKDGDYEYKPVGSGNLVLSFDTVTYCGGYNGDNTTVEWPCSAIPAFPYRPGHHIEFIYGDMSYVFLPDDGRQVMRLVLAKDEITELRAKDARA